MKQQEIRLSLNTLSRLKGIETAYQATTTTDNLVFESTFPFEGN